MTCGFGITLGVYCCEFLITGYRYTALPSHGTPVVFDQRVEGSGVGDVATETDGTEHRKMMLLTDDRSVRVPRGFETFNKVT